MSEPATPSRFRIAGIALAVVVVAAVAILKTAQQRSLAAEAARRKVTVEAGPWVRTVVTGGGDQDTALAFQGESNPIAATTLYAKIGGFLKEMRVDKGSRVRKGEVLAIVESPETARQTEALKSAYENLQRTAQRMSELGRQGIANAQDVDNAAAAAQVAKEQWASQVEVENYQKVLAPFDGVVSARFVDLGAFIQNATTSLSSQPIVSLADTSRLRVDFFLDQATAARVKVGQTVEVSPADRPDLVRTGRIDRLAGTLDVRTRTMLAEAELDNQDGRFLGGGYVKVALRLPDGAGRMEIPAEALLMRGENPFAAAVEAGRVHMLPLVLGEDAGSRVRVLQGLRAGTRVILNPNPGLRDGDPVQVVE
ncbi:MAG: efflux RND transporter periplasmic adaptor subunit [Holophaga sp.]|jgi:RND family efflux transporter MFP subunit